MYGHIIARFEAEMTFTHIDNSYQTARASLGSQFTLKT